jgi:hypothetical protein
MYTSHLLVGNDTDDDDNDDDDDDTDSQQIVEEDKAIDAGDQSTSKKASRKIKFISKVHDNHSQFCTEKEATADAKSIKSSTSSKSGIRRSISYLSKRKTTKADRDDVTKRKENVSKGLDKFLQTVEDRGPVPKEDGRSVVSAVRSSEVSKKRASDLKKKQLKDRMEQQHTENVATSGKGAKPSLAESLERFSKPRRTSSHGSSDARSVISAPARPLLQRQDSHSDPKRPVVSLRETHFSKKLRKMSFAF